MNSLGKRAFSPLSLAFCIAILSGCSSPPPPPPPLPPVERHCEKLDNTEVLGEPRAENGQVTRMTTTTRCITQ
jgi:hypothetical protein